MVSNFKLIKSCDVEVYENNNGEKRTDDRYRLISDGCLVDDPFVQRNACKEFMR